MTTVSVNRILGNQKSEDSPTNIVLDVQGLKVYYETPTGDVKAVDDVSFQIYQGEIVGLVGESGCGKTTTAMAILRLTQPPGRIVDGKIMLDGTDIASLNDQQSRRAAC